MRIVFVILGLIGSLGLMWIGIHQLLGEVPYPFTARGTSMNVAALICLALIVIGGRAGASINKERAKRGGPVTLKRRFRVTTTQEGGDDLRVREVESKNREEAIAFVLLEGLTLVEVKELPGESLISEPMRRFRVTTKREGGDDLVVQELEGQNREDVTAFALLEGLTVVKVEELTEG